jgi:hypothetical protein
MKLKKRSQSTFDGLAETFCEIPREELELIRGGTSDMDIYIKLITQIFKFDDPRLTYDQKVFFKGEISMMFFGSDIGHEVLTQLAAKNIAIDISADRVPQGYAAYEESANRLIIGNIVPDYQAGNGLNLSAISHEIFHAYNDIVVNSNKTTSQSLAYSHDAKAEVDASIFSYVVAIQVDFAHNSEINDDDSNARLGIQLAVGDSGPSMTASQRAVRTAWDDMFQNGHFTVENYNALVNNFKSGTSYNVAKETYTPIKSLSEIKIDDLFQQHYAADAALFKKMNEDVSATPLDILSANPGMHIPSDITLPSSNGGTSGGGGDAIGNYPSTGSGSGYFPVVNDGSFYWGTPDSGSGSSGNGGYSDKTGWWQDSYGDGSSSY